MASIDKAKILRGNDIVINEFITIHQPTLDEIVDFGEQRFFSTFYTFCSIPSDMKSVLADANMDFMKVTDWQLFIMLTRTIPLEDTYLVIPNIDFAKLQPMKVVENDSVVLAEIKEDGSAGMIITEEMYLEFIPYVREQIGYVLKREKAGNKFTKQILIDEDRKKREESKGKEYESTTFPLILSLVNTEEFSYTFKTVYEITLFQLLKSFFQIQNKKSACALYQGSMSGFVDTSKINKSSFSWIYDETKFS